MNRENRAKEVWCTKLYSHVSHSIMHQIMWILAEIQQHEKHYKIIHRKQRIKRIENVTSWRSTSGNARSKAWQASNLLQNTCYEDWWRIWGLELCRSCLNLNCHGYVLELHMHDSGPNLMIQGLIYTKSTPENKNMEEYSKVMWRFLNFD